MNDRGWPVILSAEDDLGDRVLRSRLSVLLVFDSELCFTANGEEFLAYRLRWSFRRSRLLPTCWRKIRFSSWTLVDHIAVLLGHPAHESHQQQTERVKQRRH